MAAELQLLSLIHIQPPTTTTSTRTNFWMWNSHYKVQKQIPAEENEDDSWEVRAFEKDITSGNQMGCTWPPRSYTCNFCKREFRSAQALGGHMNVHRRDRARLHQQHPPLLPCSSSSEFPKSPISSTILVPSTQEFLPNGLCLFYSLPNNPNGVFPENSPSSTELIPISPITANKLVSHDYPPPIDMSSRACQEYYNKAEPSESCSEGNIIDESNDVIDSFKDSAMEELDLELRLGRRIPKP